MLLSTTAYINASRLIVCYSAVISLPGLVQGSRRILDDLNGTAPHAYIPYVLSKLKYVFSKCFNNYSTF